MILHWTPSSVHGQSESQIIKAAYIRNALNFAHWPKGSFESNNSPFVLGIAGDASDFEENLKTAFSQLKYRILKRSVEVISFENPDDLIQGLKGSNSPFCCQSIYIPESEKSNVGDWLQAAANKPILLISDIPEFIEQGGAVSLTPDPRTPKRFIYNVHLPRLKSTNIRFESNFLRIRSTVKVITKETTPISRK